MYARLYVKINSPEDMDNEVIDKATGTEVQTELTSEDTSKLQKELNVLYEEN